MDLALQIREIAPGVFCLVCRGSYRYTVFTNHTLEVANVQSDDSGEYSCEVITTVDHVEATGSITVVGVCVYVCACLCAPLCLCFCVCVPLCVCV